MLKSSSPPVDATDRTARLCARVFLLAGLPCLLLLALVTGPMGVPDEGAHFLRAVAIAEGGVLPLVRRDAPPGLIEPRSAGGMVDAGAEALQRNVPFDSLHDARYKLTRADMATLAAIPATGTAIYARHSNTAIYPPLLYAVPAVVIAVADAVGAAPLAWLYAARLVNALLAGLLLWWAIGRARDAAPFLLVGATLPVMLFQGASVSADALLLPLVAVFASILVRLSARIATSRRENGMAAIATAVVAIGKVAYLPLAVLPPLAARLADGRWSPRARTLLAAAVAALVLWLGWAAIVQGKVFSIRPDVLVDPTAQLRGMLAEPIDSARFVGYTMIRSAWYYLRRSVGMQLGWGEIEFPTAFTMAALAMLFLSAIPTASRDRRSIPLLGAALVAALVSYVAVFALIYMQFNAVGAPEIVGVQGRYLTPLLLVLLALTPRLPVGRRMAIGVGVIAGWSVLSAVTTLWTVYARYWVA